MVPEKREARNRQPRGKIVGIAAADHRDGAKPAVQLAQDVENARIGARLTRILDDRGDGPVEVQSE
jgi:hypothetical protein